MALKQHALENRKILGDHVVVFFWCFGECISAPLDEIMLNRRLCADCLQERACYCTYAANEGGEGGSM